MGGVGQHVEGHLWDPRGQLWIWTNRQGVEEKAGRGRGPALCAQSWPHTVSPRSSRGPHRISLQPGNPSSRGARLFYLSLHPWF